MEGFEGVGMIDGGQTTRAAGRRTVGPRYAGRLMPWPGGGGVCVCACVWVGGCEGLHAYPRIPR